MTVETPWSPQQREYRKFVRTVALFRRKLLSAKKQAQPANAWDWYPYDSLGSWCRLDKMFRGRCQRILGRLAPEPVLDIGCADGELAFFLESLGHRVHAVDWLPTNYNGMRGVGALKTALESSVEIHEVDLDSQFRLPVSQCGLALLLGVLYHVKNPFFVLEKLAQHCRYCVFSTTVTRFTPDRHTDLDGLPVAYLLDDGELNSDATNHWIFAEAGLRRLLKKTNWEILEYAAWGDTRMSVPDSARRELRVFGLLKSRWFNDPSDSAELLDGWHELEERRWRWTKKRFSVVLEAMPQVACRLRLEFFVPGRLIALAGNVRIDATVEGVRLESAEYHESGPQVYARLLGPEAVGSHRLTVQFELDTSIGPDDSDPRERGIVVSKVFLETVEKPPRPKQSSWRWSSRR